MQPVRSEKPLTEPQEFSFATTSRFGPKVGMDAFLDVESSPPSQKKKKLSETRVLSVTVPEPFHFSTDYRTRKIRSSLAGDVSEDEYGMALDQESRGRETSAQNTPLSVSRDSKTQAQQHHQPPSSPWIPLKEKMRALEQATPEHWKKVARPRSPVRALVLTKPVEPLLHTAVRSHSRPSMVEETEAQKMAALATSQQFKAHPLNRKILESSGDMGVLRVVKRPLTQPQSPKLRVAALATRRPTVAELREKSEKEAAQKRIFKALPINSALHRHPQDNPSSTFAQPGSTPRKTPAHGTCSNGTSYANKPLTVAESPMLRTKQRSAMHANMPEETPSKQGGVRKVKMIGTKAPAVSEASRLGFGTGMDGRGPVGANHTPARVKRQGGSVEERTPNAPYAPLQLTIPQPFSLATEERSVMEEQRRNERLEKERRAEEERRIFKARPMPAASAIAFRPQLELHITEPEPFALRSEVLHEAAQQQLEERLALERQEKLAKMQFKARPMPHAKPMEVKRSLKPLTEVSHFTLNSEQRSTQREAFEAKKQSKESLAKLNEERRMALELERQKQDMKRRRAELVHKALPVPQTTTKPPAPIRASCQPLTEPKTPNFHTSSRKMMRTTTNAAH